MLENGLAPGKCKVFQGKRFSLDRYVCVIAVFGEVLNYHVWYFVAILWAGMGVCVEKKLWLRESLLIVLLNAYVGRIWKSYVHLHSVNLSSFYLNVPLFTPL